MKNIMDFFYRSWWVFLFLIFSFVIFERMGEKKEREIFKHKSDILRLEKEKRMLADINQNLLLEINSQKENSWIEMILMKNLGVVPEGKIKVRFIKK